MITKFKRNLKQQTWRIRVSQSRMKQEITEKMEELALLRLCKATLPSGEKLRGRESEKKKIIINVQYFYRRFGTINNDELLKLTACYLFLE